MSSQQQKKKFHRSTWIAPIACLAIGFAFFRCAPNTASVNKSLLNHGGPGGGGVGSIIPELSDRNRTPDQLLETSAQPLDSDKYWNALQLLSGDTFRLTLKRQSKREQNLDEFKKSGKTIITLSDSDKKPPARAELKVYLELDLSADEISEFNLDDLKVSFKQVGVKQWLLSAEKGPTDSSVSRIYEDLKGLSIVVTSKDRVEGSK